MKPPRLPLPALAIGAVAALAFAGGVFVSQPAHAQAAPEPVCKTFPGPKVEAGSQAFMAEQLAAGKTNFVSPVGYVLCAW